ncbi:MAG: fibrobacter succinogenes major paralogous domain-containing protein, partial [Bacteroidia bacterium]
LLIFGAMRLTFLLLLLLLSVGACKTPDPKPVELGETKIGRQVWMRENLRVDTFRNGDPIKHAQSPEAWAEALRREEPAWCFYDNDPDNDWYYGRIYNYYAVMDKRCLCPNGWYIPSDGEWTELEKFLGGPRVAGGSLKSTLMKPADGGWESPNEKAVDDVGFGARPGGLRAKDGTFYNAGLTGMWWTSTVNLSKMSWYREVNFFSGRLYRTFNYREDAFSVRCLKLVLKKQEPPQLWIGDK